MLRPCVFENNGAYRDGRSICCGATWPDAILRPRACGGVNLFLVGKCCRPYKDGEIMNNRRSIRYKGYDYGNPGFYFLTLCAHGQKPIFGEVRGTEIVLSQAGSILLDCWNQIPRTFKAVRPDAFVVMPNHSHGIIQIMGSEFQTSPFRMLRRDGLGPKGTKPRALSSIVQNFKSVSTRRIRAALRLPGLQVWQRNYYEHIIRSEKSLNMIRLYIELNPRMWVEGIDLRDVRFNTDEEIDLLLRKYRG